MQALAALGTRSELNWFGAGGGEVRSAQIKVVTHHADHTSPHRPPCGPQPPEPASSLLAKARTAVVHEQYAF